MCETMFLFVICAEMARRSLLRPDIDSKHRAALLEANPDSLDTLITRTPKYNWMIHPAWIERFVYYLFVSRMYILMGHTN